MLHNNSPKVANLFECNKCNYKCSKKTDFNKHLSTSKHINVDKCLQESRQTNLVCKCGKIFSFRQSLSVHKKKCNYENMNDTTFSKQIIDFFVKEKEEDKKEMLKENTEIKNIIIELLKSNNELQKQMIDVCKNNSTTNNTINNNSHNKTFNLQFFLNEQCKDAMNMSDFIKSFDLQLSDLETVGELGYIEGTTKIFLEKINKMDVYKRPIHCSDAKREIIYVKDENVWTKEEKDYPKLRKAIKVISFNNMKLVYNWSMANPDSLDNETKLNDTYIKLVFETSGGKGLIIDSENKIIRRIVKEIIIDKV